MKKPKVRLIVLVNEEVKKKIEILGKKLGSGGEVVRLALAEYLKK